MSLLQVTKKEIKKEVDALPPETLPELQTFIQYLRFKSEHAPDEIVENSGQELWRAALKATFGMWADRDDIAEDSVVYVQHIRRGHRLNDLLEPIDETD